MLLAEMSEVARKSGVIRADFQHVHSLKGEIRNSQTKEQRRNGRNLPRALRRSSLWGRADTRRDILHGYLTQAPN